MKPAYYNEIDPYAAQWLRNLIAAGHLPAGDVDERSIEDVKPDDLRGYTQCHFFAGIGGWAYALALAGWPPGRPVWTGSCPCQPFSAAGKGAGFDDQRHLWPAWFHLIRECRPAIVFGEQVASKDAEPWVDLVHADLEGVGYTFGCVPFPAAGVGAPHIRDRNYWLGYANDARLEGFRSGYQAEGRHGQGSLRSAAASAELVRLAHTDGGNTSAERQQRSRQHVQRDQDRAIGGVADAAGQGWRPERQNIHATHCAKAVRSGEEESGRRGTAGWPGPLHGFWDAADWLFCRDGKWRPVEPGTFPLAHGVSGRMGRLRAYGNAIVPQEAAEFVASLLDIEQILRVAA